MKNDMYVKKEHSNLAYLSPVPVKSRDTKLAGAATSMPKIIVVDDDPIFRAQIEKVAEKRGLTVTTCASSVKELSALAVGQVFDVVVIDYFIDNIDEHFKGTDVASVLEGTPVILISATDEPFEDNNPWPVSVRKFVNKKAGINAILDSAIQLRSFLTTPFVARARRKA